MKKLSFILVLLMTVALAFAQDLETVENPFVFPDEYSSASPGEAQRGGQFRAYGISDFDSFNPFVGSGAPNLYDDGMGNFVSLVTRNPLNLSEWVPYMAESYEFSEDNTNVTFKIREGMRFSDGEEITADDWITTYRIHTDPDVGSNLFNNFFIDDEPITVEKTRGIRNCASTFRNRI